MIPERRGGFSLGQILGIPVRIHWSWLLVLGLVALSLTFGYFPLFRRALAPSSYLILGAVTAALFCASLLAHELAHALVARRERIAVRGITLFAFGGVAELAEQPRTPGAELRMAAAGPLASLGLAWAVQHPRRPRRLAVHRPPLRLAGRHQPGPGPLQPPARLPPRRRARPARRAVGPAGEPAPGDAHRRRRRAARLLGLRPGRPGDGPDGERLQRPLAGGDRVLPALGRLPPSWRRSSSRRPRPRPSPYAPVRRAVPGYPDRPPYGPP